jgi:hypothetical protein
MTKITYFFTVLLALFFSGNAMAQKRQGALQIGAQYGPTPYETMDGLGLSAGYEWNFNRFFSAAAVVGFVRDGYQVEGRSSGQDASGSWDNRYAYWIREQFNYLDLTGLYNVTPSSKRNRLEVGLGAGMTYTMLEYPKDLFIDKGVITNLNYENHDEWVAMAHLTIANRVKVSKRIEIFARLTGRQAFKESPLLERKIRSSGGGLFSSSSNVRNNFTLSIGLGYLIPGKSEAVK